MKQVDPVALALALATGLFCVVMLWLASCAPLPLPGNPRCFACGNCMNGTVAEDPKCCVGPCTPGQHEGEGEGE